ncbi:MAG TPA: DUF6489 family protein [Rhizomicrobium sp.]|jgi:hypothetical protein|nr:DUF6489 family protein [Rhizomicrobium sp.]
MKVNVEIDMTPEEARRFMGLPDVTPLNDKFVDEMSKRMKSVLDDPETAMKTWVALSGQGVEQIQRFFWDAASRTLSKKTAGKTTR